MLALFDAYDHRTQELVRSLRTAGIGVTPVVIRYQGELPDEALCPFTTYTGIELRGEPLFFDEVPVPAWCEIRQGTQVYGEILRDGAVLGRIHYAPGTFRQVESVDWLLPDGSPGHTDHYDRYGSRYATTHHHLGAAYQTVYRGPGEWEIEVHHPSRAITLRSPQGLLTFDTLTDFVSYFLDDLGIGTDDGVLINSLSHPLFVMRRRSTAPRTTLFWQEPLPDGVPENMASELAEPVALSRIVFFDRAQRELVAASRPDSAVDLAYLSHLGQFAAKEGYDLRRTFTLTNTDEIPGLVELLEAFPDVRFTVAALTLMSQKLHDIGRRYPNLTLIPTISQRRIHEELDRASVYLDINAGPHVLDVVDAAYYLDLVVLALGPYAKEPGRSLVLTTNDELAARLADVVASPQGRAKALDDLHTLHGPLSSPADYHRLLGRTPGLPT